MEVSIKNVFQTKIFALPSKTSRQLLQNMEITSTVVCDQNDIE